MEVEDEALPFLDLVVVGWAVFRRQEELNRRGGGR